MSKIMAMDKDDRNDNMVVLNLDILLHTLDFLHLGMRERNPSARVTLARCARLSRASSTPALRLLWSTLCTPTPLWLLLMFDWTWTARKQMSLDELVQTILDAKLWNEPDRWDHFVRYAQLVREVTFHSGSDKKDEMNTVGLLASLLERSGGQAIFPSLRVFSWKSTTKTHHDGDVIGLIFGFHSIGLKGILLCMGYAAPSLEAYIDTSISPHVPLLWIGDELTQFQNLRTIQINAPVRHRDIHAVLARLPLIHLRVSVTSKSASGDCPLSASALRVLDIYGAPSDLAAILASWSLPSLERAKISLFDETSHSRDIYQPDLAAAIVAPLPQTTLRTLHISLSGASSPRRTAALSLAQFLRPSFQLRSLEEFTLRAHDWYIKLCADDDAFAELAEAWPSLRSLVLDIPSWHAGGPIPTPLVLHVLACSCRGMQELVLPYLDHTVDLETLPPRGTLHAHPLRRLCIVDDRTKHSKLNVAREAIEALRWFIDELFPHFSLSSNVRHCRKGRGPWTEVFDGLRCGRHKH